jgi:hypothetical protein
MNRSPELELQLITQSTSERRAWAARRRTVTALARSARVRRRLVRRGLARLFTRRGPLVNEAMGHVQLFGTRVAAGE